MRRGAERLALAGLLLAHLALAGCAGTYQPMGPAVAHPSLAAGTIVAADGYRLPTRLWAPEGRPRAVILALHGFGDYSNGFDGPARLWAADGILTYAYDQRGFGQSPRRGIWPGAETLVADVRAAAAAIRAAHPGVPLFLLGESMGGGLAIVALTDPHPPDVDGAILVAAAVWGRETMPFYQRLALWVAVNTVPWLNVDGEGFEVAVTDNIDALRALAGDPLVLGAVRLDMLDGLVDLMSLALERGHLLDLPTLVLYGEHEEVVPPEPIEVLMDRLPPGPRRVALYPDGYHLLLRDLQAAVVIEDIAAWTADPHAPLASGLERPVGTLRATAPPPDG